MGKVIFGVSCTTSEIFRFKGIYTLTLIGSCYVMRDDIKKILADNFLNLLASSLMRFLVKMSLLEANLLSDRHYFNILTIFHLFFLLKFIFTTKGLI